LTLPRSEQPHKELLISLLPAGLAAAIEAPDIVWSGPP
jgi:hypothetical protein